jgi:4-hydroxy 2-oxovalerate aldolase
MVMRFMSNVFKGTDVKNLKIRNGIYYWRQKVGGVQYSESLNTRDVNTAVEAMKARRALVESGAPSERRGKMTKKQDVGGDWVSFNPDLKVLDCTIRDGGLVTNCEFEDDFVRAVHQSLSAAGVDYMELGYKADQKIFNRADFGKWKFTTEEDIRDVLGDTSQGPKLSVLVDVGRTNYKQDILPKDQSALDLIRVACYIHQIPAALDMVNDARDKGYQTSLNLMAVSTVPDYELDKGLALIGASNVDMLYVVDSFGSLYYEQIGDLISRYRAAVGPDKEIGIHAHNNQQLAYANTMYAAINGVTMLDTTIDGLGRGAGNCSTELMLGFLKNPKFNMRPILECIQNQVVPLRERYDWGYSHPYMITGQMNEHPRSAMAIRETERKDACLAFYDDIIDR